MSQPIRSQGGHLVFPICPKKNKIGREHWDKASCQVSHTSYTWVQCATTDWPGWPFLFTDRPKKWTNLVEDVEILLSVKFCWMPYSGFRAEVQNVSANQSPGQPSCFSDQPEKHKLGRGRLDHTSCPVLLNSIQQFQRRSWKCEKLMPDDGHRPTCDHNTCSALEPSAQVH